MKKKKKKEPGIMNPDVYSAIACLGRKLYELCMYSKKKEKKKEEEEEEGTDCKTAWGIKGIIAHHVVRPAFDYIIINIIALFPKQQSVNTP